ncbi:MAG: ferrous iron transport protein B [Bacteroidales bacterium]|nr:ferrous iron transport protein B [Bacteroidales bacterium]
MAQSIKIAVVGFDDERRGLFCKTVQRSFGGYSLDWQDTADPEHMPLERPDVIVQLVDSADLDESLVMTPQLIDMHMKLVLVFDRYDALAATQHALDTAKLGDLVGAQTAIANHENGQGIETVLQKVVDAHENKVGTSRHVHVKYGKDVEKAISKLVDELAHCPSLAESNTSTLPLSKRYLAIRLLERPEAALSLLSHEPNYKALKELSDKLVAHLERELRKKPADIFHEARHGYISGALGATLHHSDDNSDHTLTQKIDAVLTNRWFGFPILIAVLLLVFECTFALGAYPQDWIQSGVDWLCDLLRGAMPDTWYTSLLVDGVVQGVGAVLAFLPNIIILFFFISLMEDTGYMSRVAFLMDKIMHKVGLHGRSFVPMLVGFGCNVPAIMAARSIENKKDRTLTMLMIPFMSCGARLPVYMLFVAAFFPKHPALVMMSLYVIGIALSILFALVMKHTPYFRKPAEDFVSELPAYRKPIWSNTWHHIWERCMDYLKKIATVILWASIIIWALYYFPRNKELTQPYADEIALLQTQQEGADAATQAVLTNAIDSLAFEMDVVQKEHSALAHIGQWIAPVMKPLGFDWRMNVCIITGLPAKEAIVSTMAILYHQKDEDKMVDSLAANPDFSPLKAYSFLLFVLLYFPCIATIATLRREIGRGWATFSVVFSIVLAWLVAFGVFQIGSLM